MSALPPKADMCGASWDVCYGPIADIEAATASTKNPPAFSPGGFPATDKTRLGGLLPVPALRKQTNYADTASKQPQRPGQWCLRRTSSPTCALMAARATELGNSKSLPPPVRCELYLCAREQLIIVGAAR